MQETGTVFDQMREKFHDSTVYTAINDRSPTHPPPVVHIAKPDHTIESLDKTAQLMIVQEVLSNRRLEETIIIAESSMPRHHSCDLVGDTDRHCANVWNSLVARARNRKKGIRPDAREIS